MLVLNRRGPISSLIGGSIGFVKEYNADRKARKEEQPEEDDNDHEWALAIDEAQQEAQPASEPKEEKQSIEDLVKRFIEMHPPPPYRQQQPVGKLSMPVILPQRRPESRTRGFVRGYAPVLEDVGVSQNAWFDFLDGFEKSITKNNVFWAANAAVWILDKAYIATFGPNIWASLIVLTIHLSVEGGRRGYIHSKHNKYLDGVNEEYFKPRGLYALIVKYKPQDLNELGEYVDVRKNVTEAVTKRDDPERTAWQNLTESSATSTADDIQIPEFAPLIFPGFDDNADSKQKESAFKHFRSFVQEYQDRQAQARFDSKNPESKLANVAPQKEWASRYSNPQHPARQGGLISIISGGKLNPKGPIQAIRSRGKERDGDNAEAEKLEAANRIAGDNKLSPGNSNELTPSTSNAAERVSSNVSSDGVDRNEVAWQATATRRQRNPLRRLLRQDVLYLLVVNMPSQAEMDKIRKQLGIE